MLNDNDRLVVRLSNYIFQLEQAIVKERTEIERLKGELAIKDEEDLKKEKEGVKE